MPDKKIKSQESLADLVGRGDEFFSTPEPQYQEALECYAAATKLNRAGDFNDIIPGFSVATTFQTLENFPLSRQNFIFYSQRLNKFKEQKPDMHEAHMVYYKKNYEAYSESLNTLIDALKSPDEKLEGISNILKPKVLSHKDSIDDNKDVFEPRVKKTKLNPKISTKPTVSVLLESINKETSNEK
jgi:hypothetical protein